jgi:hypothetical protein
MQPIFISKLFKGLRAGVINVHIVYMLLKFPISPVNGGNFYPSCPLINIPTEPQFHQDCTRINNIRGGIPLNAQKRMKLSANHPAIVKKCINNCEIYLESLKTHSPEGSIRSFPACPAPIYGGRLCKKATKLVMIWSIKSTITILLQDICTQIAPDLHPLGTTV